MMREWQHNSSGLQELETDRRVYETEQFPGRRACKARTEMDDGSGGLARTADGSCCGVRRGKGKKETIRATSSFDKQLGAGTGIKVKTDRVERSSRLNKVLLSLSCRVKQASYECVLFIVGEGAEHKPSGGTRIPTISLPFWCLDARITDVVLRLH